MAIVQSNNTANGLSLASHWDSTTTQGINKVFRLYPIVTGTGSSKILTCPFSIFTNDVLQLTSMNSSTGGGVAPYNSTPSATSSGTQLGVCNGVSYFDQYNNFIQTSYINANTQISSNNTQSWINVDVEVSPYSVYAVLVQTDPNNSTPADVDYTPLAITAEQLNATANLVGMGTGNPNNGFAYTAIDGKSINTIVQGQVGALQQDVIIVGISPGLGFPVSSPNSGSGSVIPNSVVWVMLNNKKFGSNAAGAC